MPLEIFCENLVILTLEIFVISSNFFGTFVPEYIFENIYIKSLRVLNSKCANTRIHSHKKRKDSLETRAALLIFSLELEISGVVVQSIHQKSEKW